MVVLSETSSAKYWMKCTRADGDVGIMSRLQHIEYRLLCLYFLLFFASPLFRFFVCRLQSQFSVSCTAVVIQCMWCGRVSVSNLSITCGPGYPVRPRAHTQRNLALPDGFLPPKLSLGLQREALLSGENNEQCKLAWPPCNEEDPSLPTHTPPNGPAFTWTKCNTTPLC